MGTEKNASELPPLPPLGDDEDEWEEEEEDVPSRGPGPSFPGGSNLFGEGSYTGQHSYGDHAVSSAQVNSARIPLWQQHHLHDTERNRR